MPKDDNKIIMVRAVDPCNRRMIIDLMKSKLNETVPIIPEEETVAIFKSGSTGMTESLITRYHYFDVDEFKRRLSAKPHVDKSVKEFCSGILGVPYVKR